MKSKHIPVVVWTAVALLFLSGCGSHSVRSVLRDVEPLLQEEPGKALGVLDSLGSGPIRGSGLRARYSLLYAIALDKNHVDDGSYVEEIARAARWYDRFGSRKDRLKANYYHGDQLRGAGRLEEAAVQFMRAEKDAVALEDWFIAGMSARSLYYVFGDTVNRPEELASIERAQEYFRLAGMAIHEDDARIKMAVACYDNYLLNKADSLFNEAIRIAEEKRDTVRLTKALIESANPMLLEEPFRPDTAFSRITRAWLLGRKPSCRSLANIAFAEFLLGDRQPSKQHLEYAYSMANNRAQYMAIVYRDYQIHLREGDPKETLLLLQKLYSDTDSLAVKILEQSIVKAQKENLSMLTEINERKLSSTRMIATIALLLFLLSLLASYILFKKVKEKHDRYRLAYEELSLQGFMSLDKISQAYYSAGNNFKDAVFNAYKDEIRQLREESSFKGKFIDNVDKTHDSIISKLRSQMPELGEKQITLFAFLVGGLSYTTISILLKTTSRQYLYNRKGDLINAIKEQSPKDGSLFLEYLQKP